MTSSPVPDTRGGSEGCFEAMFSMTSSIWMSSVGGTGGEVLGDAVAITSGKPTSFGDSSFTTFRGGPGEPLDPSLPRFCPSVDGGRCDGACTDICSRTCLASLMKSAQSLSESNLAAFLFTASWSTPGFRSLALRSTSGIRILRHWSRTACG